MRWLLVAVLLVPCGAWAALISAQPTPLPVPLADIGASAPVSTNGQTCPVILFGSGQSNMVSQDHNGDHTIQSNILITNDYASPTAIVPAIYGTAPLNLGYGGSPNTGATTTTGTSSLSYVSQMVSFANGLRLSGTIPASRKILLAIGAQGGQSIIDWVAPVSSFTGTIAGTTLTVSAVASGTIVPGQVITGTGIGTSVTITAYGTGAGGTGTYTISTSTTVPTGETISGAAPVNMVTDVQAQWSVVSTAYPGCPINAVVWDQGENDASNAAYGTQATYGAAFTGGTYQGAVFIGTQGLVPLFQSLSGWNAQGTQTRWINVGLGGWSGNTQQARNDFLQTTRAGALYPWMTFVPSPSVSGQPASMGPDNPIPHYRGDAQNAIGAEEAAAYLSGWGTGAYSSQNGYNGGALAIANSLVVPTTTSFTATISGYNLIVTAVSAGTITKNMFIVGSGVSFPTTITSQLSGATGGAGTYSLSTTQTEATSETMTAGPSFGPDDLRSGAVIYTVGLFQLPPAIFVPGATIWISTIGAPGFAPVFYSTSPTNFENLGQLANGIAISLKSGTLYSAVAVNGVWVISSLYPRFGSTQWAYTMVSANSAATISLANMNHQFYTLGGNNAITANPTYGSDIAFYNQGSVASTITNSGGYSFYYGGGSSATTISLQPGEMMEMVGIQTGTNTLSMVVLSDSGPAPFTVATLPTCTTALRGRPGYFVTDAASPTYNGILTGGGAVFVPVSCNGSVWSSH